MKKSNLHQKLDGPFVERIEQDMKPLIPMRRQGLALSLCFELVTSHILFCGAAVRIAHAVLLHRLQARRLDNVQTQHFGLVHMIWNL